MSFLRGYFSYTICFGLYQGFPKWAMTDIQGATSSKGARGGTMSSEGATGGP